MQPVHPNVSGIFDGNLNELPHAVSLGNHKGVTGTGKRTFTKIREERDGKAAKIRPTVQSNAVIAHALARRVAPAAAMPPMPKIPHSVLRASRQDPAVDTSLKASGGKRAHATSEKEPRKEICRTVKQSNPAKDLPTPKQFSVFCKRGEIEKVRAALEAGFDIHAPPDVRRPDILPAHLNHACSYGHLEVARLLIQYGADVNESKEGGEAPLHKACIGGHLEIVGLLLKERADVNKITKSRKTPLHEACLRGNIGIVQLLLANRADVNPIDNNGCIPLHLACEIEHVEIVRFLIANRADVKAMNRDHMTPLHSACLGGRLGVVISINGGSVNAAYVEGRMAFESACKRQHAEVIQCLLDAGADINTVDKNKNTPLHTACRHDHLEMVQLLLASGADSNAANKYGTTPLHYATSSLAKLLLQNGAEVNKQDFLGNAPLHLACRRGSKEQARLLLEHGANHNLTNRDRLTPFKCALNPEEFKKAVYLSRKIH